MTAPTITGISFDQSYYEAGQTITAVVTYQTSNQYSDYDFIPVITDLLTNETSSETAATFVTAYNGTGPESYSDDFSSDTLNAYWVSFASTNVSVEIGSAQVQINLPGGSQQDTENWGGIVAASASSLIGSSYASKITDIGAAPEGNQRSSVGIYLTDVQSSSSTFSPLGDDNCLFMTISSSIGSSTGVVACGYDSQSPTTISWDNSNPYIRIREESGEIYWDNSPDGITWTNITSLSDSVIPFNLDSLYANLAGLDIGDVGGSTVALTDFSYIPAGAGIPDPTSATATDSGNRTWTLAENTLTGSAPPFTGTAIFTATA